MTRDLNAPIFRCPAPAVCLSDDLDELLAEEDRLKAEWDAAEAALIAADDAHDMAAYDQASETFDRVDNALFLVRRRIDELEEDEAWAAIREARSEFWRAVL